MIDKELIRLIGKNKKYIFIAVALQVLGLIANVSITASICRAVYLAISEAEPITYIYPAIGALVGIAVRYAMTKLTGDIKDNLGRKVKKDLREQVYNKIVRLGVKSTDGMSMAGLTQVSMEGIEQLDLYYSSYLPQFFYAMLAPVILFLITVWIDWRVALVLLACVPLIPVSIVAVSKYAKKIFAKYWGKYTSMGDKFLDSVQGLKELMIFKADGAQHKKMNESAEEFRKITMKVLVMQLASTTIMDLVAYGGAGVGIALSVCGAAFWGVNPVYALFLCLVAVEFFLPIRAFGSAFHVAMNGASAGKKIITLLNAPDPIWGREEVNGKTIELKDVTFSYDGKRDALKSVNMTFPEKGMTAIVGESGCGKTTLLRLLARLNKPTKGELEQFIDKKFGTKKKNKKWYNRVGVVYQNPDYQLFMPTVEKEISFGAENKEYAEEMIKLFGLEEIKERHPQSLSEGQKRRVSIAAVAATNPEVLLLDEPTVGQDYAGLCKLVEILNALHKRTGNTMVTVTHDMRCAEALCDRAVLIEGGVIKEQGGKDLAHNYFFHEE